MATVSESIRSSSYEVLTGNYCAAYAAKLARVEVVTGYPITPQSSVIEKISEFIASSELKAKFINVESEHSALSALLGASAAGVRTFTATSRQGLLLMHEAIVHAGRGRVPVVMVVVNGSVGPPFTIVLEQDDSFMQRDTGWIQLYCQDNQEILDSVIQAFYIAEHVSLPVMVVYDGVLGSHTSEPVCVPNIEMVDRYLPRRETVFKLDPDKPLHIFATPVRDVEQHVAKLRRGIEDAMETTKEVAKRADKEFKQYFGRDYGIMECYQVGDAEIVFIAVTSIASIAHDVIDELRAEGKKVGLLRVKMFRPFPKQEMVTALRNAKKLAVVDRNFSHGRSGILAMEIKACMYDQGKRPPIFGFVAGLGGLDVHPSTIREIIKYTYQHDHPAEETTWIDMPPSRG